MTDQKQCAGILHEKILQHLKRVHIEIVWWGIHDQQVERLGEEFREKRPDIFEA